MTCPYCHSTERFGIRLPRLKAAILDYIKRAGDVGATATEVIGDCYLDRRPVKPSVVKSHANQINDLLVGTDWRLRSDGRRWFLRRTGGRQ